MCLNGLIFWSVSVSFQFLCYWFLFVIWRWWTIVYAWFTIPTSMPTSCRAVSLLQPMEIISSKSSPELDLMVFWSNFYGWSILDSVFCNFWWFSAWQDWSLMQENISYCPRVSYLISVNSVTSHRAQMSKRSRSGQRFICLRQWPEERPFRDSMKAPLLSQVSLSFPAATSIAAGIAAVCTSLPSTFSMFCSWIYLITLWSCWCCLLRFLWQQSLQIHYLLCVEVLSFDCFTLIFLKIVSANAFFISGFNKQLFSIQLTHSLREFVKVSHGPPTQADKP